MSTPVNSVAAGPAVSTTLPTFSASSVAEVVGRFLLASLFLSSGLGKIAAYGGTAAYMASAGVPGALLPLVIAIEVLGAVAIIAGWQTRLVAIGLAVFSVLAGVLFHHNFADQIQMIMFLKNVSIAGAFLMLAGNGAGPISLDRKLSS